MTAGRMALTEALGTEDCPVSQHDGRRWVERVVQVPVSLGAWLDRAQRAADRQARADEARVVSL